MAPYIFMEKNGIHIIDLNKTEAKLKEAANALKQIAKSGRKILFVATKKQAKDIVAEKVKAINMPYVTERWPGGMLTNFPTIRKAVKKMGTIDRMETDGTFATLSKREKLQVARQRAKLEKMLGSIADLTRLPAAMFVVDITKEYIAVREAKRLNIPVFAMVDTNSNPKDIDFAIPANDDASKSISLILDYVCEAIAEGLSERKMEKEKEVVESKDKKEKKSDDKPEVRGHRPRKSAAKAEKPAAGKPAADTVKSDVKKEETAEVKAGEKAEVKEEKAEAKAENTTAKEEKKEEKTEVKTEVKAEVKEAQAEVKEAQAEVKKEEKAE